MRSHVPIDELSGAVSAIVDDGIGHSSYVVDLCDGTALVVDPARVPDLEEADAARRGLRVAATADTHSHADYVSGSPELAAKGARFLAPAGAALEVPHDAVRDGDRVTLGSWQLEVIATPGHTPDHAAYLLRDAGGAPRALFSGGSLMVGTVGRTDLLGPDHAAELAHRQFHSLHDRILVLPDDLLVLPTHGAGSFCSVPGGAARTSTVGRERATNAMLQIDSEQEFVDALARFGSFPPYFRRLPEVNRRGPTLYGAVPELPRLDIETFRALRDQGAQVVDVRPIAQFAVRHVAGALSIELRPVSASWFGWLVDPSRPAVFVLDDAQDRRELVRQCLTVGVELLAGELAGGQTAWDEAGLPSASVALVEPGRAGDTIIDVRQRDEFASGHLPGARNIELGALAAADLVGPGPVTVVCGHGERAMTGASVLARAGHDEVSVLVGGPTYWVEATGRRLELGP